MKMRFLAAMTLATVGWVAQAHAHGDVGSNQGQCLMKIGPDSMSFTGYQPRVYNWGVSLTRERYNLRMNWNYRGRRRGSPIAESPRSIEPGTFNWISKRLYVDVSGEVSLTRRIQLFGSLRNVGDATEDSQRWGPSTPAHARFRSREDFGSLWTFGVKGTF